MFPKQWRVHTHTERVEIHAFNEMCGTCGCHTRGPKAASGIGPIYHRQHAAARDPRLTLSLVFNYEFCPFTMARVPVWLAYHLIYHRCQRSIFGNMPFPIVTSEATLSRLTKREKRFPCFGHWRTPNMHITFWLVILLSVDRKVFSIRQTFTPDCGLMFESWNGKTIQNTVCHFALLAYRLCQLELAHSQHSRALITDESDSAVSDSLLGLDWFNYGCIM